MSQVSTVVDNIVTRLDALLTSAAGWNKLPFAYDITKNDEKYLKQGYAFAIGPGTNSKRLQSSKVSQRREITITLTRANDTLDSDEASKKTLEKTILENMRTVVADFEGNQTLNSGEIPVEFSSDQGIQFVNDENEEFLMIQGTFFVEYFE